MRDGDCIGNNLCAVLGLRKKQFIKRGTFGDESASEDQPTREQVRTEQKEDRIGDNWKRWQKAARIKPKTDEERERDEASAKRNKTKAEMIGTRG